MVEPAGEVKAGSRGMGSSAVARYPIPAIRGGHTRSFFPALALTFFAWAVSWPFVTFAFLNRSDSSDVAWIHRLYERKDVAMQRAGHTGRPRLVIVGGSGALFGIDAELISRRLLIEVINDATHAGLGTYILHQAQSVLREGDSVLLCPEYETWWQPGVSDIEWKYTSTYDKRYLWRSGIADGIRSLYSLPADEYWDSFAAWGEWLRGRDATNNYNVAMLDTAGDLRLAVRTVPLVVSKRCDLPDPDGAPGPLQAFRRFGRWAKGHHVRVFYSWPNVCRPITPLPDVIPAATGKLLDECGFIALNAPAETAYPPSWFYDTVYHLDGGGRRVRTEAMIRRLAPYYHQPSGPADPVGIYLVGHRTVWLRDGNAFDSRPGVQSRYLMPQATDTPDAITPDELAPLARRGVPVYCDDPAVQALLPSQSWEMREVDRDEGSISAWLKRYEHHLIVLARAGGPAAPGAAPLSSAVSPDVRAAIEGGRPAWAVIGTGPLKDVHLVRTGDKSAQLKARLPSLIQRSVPSLSIIAEARDGHSRIRADVRIVAEADDGQICAAVFEPEQGILVDAATFAGGSAKMLWSMKQLSPRPASSAATDR